MIKLKILIIRYNIIIQIAISLLSIIISGYIISLYSIPIHHCEELDIVPSEPNNVFKNNRIYVTIETSKGTRGLWVKDTIDPTWNIEEYKQKRIFYEKAFQNINQKRTIFYAFYKGNGNSTRVCEVTLIEATLPKIHKSASINKPELTSTLSSFPENIQKIFFNPIDHIENLYHKSLQALTEEKVNIDNIKLIKKIILTTFLKDPQLEAWRVKTEADMKEGLSCQMLEVLQVMIEENINQTIFAKKIPGIIAAHMATTTIIINISYLQNINPSDLINGPLYDQIFQALITNTP